MKSLLLSFALAAFAITALPSTAIAAESETAAPAPKKLLVGVPEQTSPLGFLWAGAIVLCCGAVAIFAKMHAKKRTIDGEAIRVVGQKSLGGRASLMLISARGRDVLLSVNEKGATLLVEWPGSPEIAMEEPVAEDRTDDFEVAPSSDAVSGLVRLRQQTNPVIKVPESFKRNAAYTAPAAFPELFGREMRKVKR